jgi:hypothetical protein
VPEERHDTTDASMGASRMSCVRESETWAAAVT